MGYLKDKYTSGYFLKRDDQGNPTWRGVEGIEDFLVGGIRRTDKLILSKINFKGARVLEIGYGRGEALKFCSDHGAGSITGVDFSKDAYAIAGEFLKQHGVEVDLHCEDALNFVKTCRQVGRKFDILLLLDVVEHIPRSELSTLLAEISELLTSKAVLVVNTPVFAVDNDVLVEGLDPRALEASDESEMTSGMHCNRYTRTSLANYLSRFGFTAISSHVFAYKLQISRELCGTRWAWISACEFGYPVNLESVNIEDVLEYAGLLPVAPPCVKVSQSPFAKVMRFCQRAYNYLKRVSRKIELGVRKSYTLPPARTPLPIVLESVAIAGGPLQGGALLFDTNLALNSSQKMRDGTYESFIYDASKFNFQLKGAVVWDVGAHIGYHALCFASMVGSEGKVITFEPNPVSRERLSANLALNKALIERVCVLEHALGDLNCHVKIHIGERTNEGCWDSGHLVTSVPFGDTAVYDGPEAAEVICRTGDGVIRDNPLLVPSLIKIDVEGSEGMCIFGCRNLLSKYRPHLIVKINSTLMMHFCMSMLAELGYRVEVMNPQYATASQCFIHACPP